MSLPFNLNLSGAAGEIMMLTGMFVAGFILAFILGKGKMVALILSFYPAFFLYSQFPFSEKLVFFKSGGWEFVLTKLVIFLLFFIPTFLIINLITGRSQAYTARNGFFGLGILSVSLGILILLLFHQVIPFGLIIRYFPGTYAFWDSDTFFFWLLIAPIVLILLFIRR